MRQQPLGELCSPNMRLAGVSPLCPGYKPGSSLLQ